MSETANRNVGTETGSLESMGSDLDSISGLRRVPKERRCTLEAETLPVRLRNVRN